MTKRIAMWSGPRNLSTAMMRSFGNRSDCFVWDEPFYGAYLALTGLEHPLRAEILTACETDWRKVRKDCLGREKPGKTVFYQKHMTHHMLPQIDRGWLAQVTNVFLIRHPARVVASYAAKRENPTLQDLGFVEQAELFDLVTGRFGQPAIVIDADDVLADPLRALTELCAALAVPFDPAMLTWAAGPRPDDGVWGRHWYGSVLTSTGFAPVPGRLPELEGAYRELAGRGKGVYRRMSEFALRPT